MEVASRNALKFKKLAIGLACISFAYLIFNMWIFNTHSILGTLLLMTIIYIFAFRIITKFSIKLNRDLSVLLLLFILKVCISIFVAYVGWIPMLDENALNYGYDPQRYYFQANELVQSGFNISSINQINYTGIIFYYALIFWVFGHNPINPILINSFTTLIACLYIIKLIKFTYPNLKGVASIGFFMMIPEIIWYDILTSRESICMTLVLICVYTLIDMVFIDKGFRIKRLILFTFAFLMLGIIRTSLLIGIILILLVYILFIKYKNNNKKSYGMVLIPLFFVLLFLIPKFTTFMGSTSFDIENIISSFNSNEIDAGFNWSNNSIGQLLIGKSFLEKIILTPIRILVYLIAPLPTINIKINELFNGNWVSWQNLMVVTSSIFYMFSLSRIFAALFDYIKFKSKNALISIFLPFFIIIVTISSGTQIIHERYRITALPFIYAVILLGNLSGASSKKQGFIVLLIMLIGCGLFYSLYKLF